MEQYYYLGELNQSQGPHNIREIFELIAEKEISPDSKICKSGSNEWIDVKEFLKHQRLSLALQPVAKLPSTASIEKPDQIATIGSSEEEKESQQEDAQEFKQKKNSRHHIIRSIRNDLDELWECQKESIIARIKDEELGKEYEATRKKQRDFFERIEAKVIEYWRRSGVLANWIEEMTWNEADYTKRLSGDSEAEKYQNFQNWLEEKQLADLAGCYCFKNGRDYLYIGKATILRDRIKDHEQKTFFTYANAIRVIIPKIKTQVGKLERLLILAHQPKENRNDGMVSRNSADDCLEFIREEIKELATDF